MNETILTKSISIASMPMHILIRQPRNKTTDVIWNMSEMQLTNLKEKPMFMPIEKEKWFTLLAKPYCLSFVKLMISINCSMLCSWARFDRLNSVFSSINLKLFLISFATANAIIRPPMTCWGSMLYSEAYLILLPFQRRWRPNIQLNFSNQTETFEVFNEINTQITKSDSISILRIKCLPKRSRQLKSIGSQIGRCKILVVANKSNR